MRFEQLLPGDRLGEEVLGPGLDGAHARRNVGVTGQENDRQAVAELRQAILELQAGQARHLHVEQNAVRQAGRRLVEELLRGLVERDLVARGVEQPRDGAAERGIVVDDMDDVWRVLHLPPSRECRGGKIVSSRGTATVLR